MAERRQLGRGKEEPRNPGFRQPKPLPRRPSGSVVDRPRSVTGKKSSGVQALIFQRAVSCTWPAGHLTVYVPVAVSTTAFLSCSVPGASAHRREHATRNAVDQKSAKEN